MPNIIKITDINSPELVLYKDLTDNQLKTGEGLFVAESVKVIEVALDKGIKPKSFLMEERQIEGIGKTLIERCPNVPIFTASREMLKNLTGFELTRGLLSLMERPKMQNIDEILKNAKKIAVLERLSDAVNVGAIFRSAAALGVDAVLIFHNCSEPLNRRTVRVSMGSVFLVPWAFFEKKDFEKPGDSVEFLKSKGFTTAALALREDSINITDEKLKNSPKIALFLGAEGDGLSQETIEKCDFTVKIPMYHGVDSLNVAAAATVSFWEICSK